jgi:hypothetical protein
LSWISSSSQPQRLRRGRLRRQLKLFPHLLHPLYRLPVTIGW